MGINDKIANGKSIYRWYINIIKGEKVNLVISFLIEIILSVSMISISLIMKMFVDAAAGTNTMELWHIIMAAVVAITFVGVSEIGLSIYKVRLNCSLEKKMRVAVMKRIFDLPVPVKYRFTIYIELENSACSGHTYSFAYVYYDEILSAD